METETYSPLGAGSTFTEVKPNAAGCVLRDTTDGELILLDRDELQALAQWAYDQFGILAAPSLEREAERAPDLIGTIRGHVEAAQAQQQVNRAGLLQASGASDQISDAEWARVRREGECDE